MGNFDPSRYATVDERIAEFYEDYPEGSIRTRVLSSDDKSIMIEARCYRTLAEARDKIYTSGIAHEVQGAGPVNKTNHVENAETSAVGRALANLGYSGSIDGKRAPRPSREEMEQARARSAGHDATLSFIRDTAARCEPDVMLEFDNSKAPLQEQVKRAWATAKRDPGAALKLARAVSDATSVPFDP